MPKTNENQAFLFLILPLGVGSKKQKEHSFASLIY
jgi:hypothetical protein